MAEEKKVMFHEMELDDRILKAISQLGWPQPTLIQETAIPLLLEGKDVLMRARTGSGKTAAFTIPVIQKILNLKNTSTHQSIKALILSPSKELCGQIASVIGDLTLKCAREVRCIDISSSGDTQTQKSMLADKPDIVVATPSRALAHLKANNMRLKDDLAMLVVDEADLIFSFGYEDEIKELLGHLPKIYQAVLASATLSGDVLSLKKIVLRNPVTLKLEEPELAPSSQLQHYHLFAEEDDKAAILYALLKLNLIRGKSIIFVRTVDRCYKLKLYLEQFKIGSCVLNSELPAAVRCLSVDQFNRGRYQIIIASDEKALEKPDGGILPLEERGKKKKPQQSKRKKDKESGVSRGIDFQHVANVINFDFPLDVNSYVHRAGRTARGNNQGSVLSFVSIREKPLMDAVEAHLTNGFKTEQVLQKYEFALEEVEGFRYRSRDAWRAVTRIAVREARLKEIKQELLNCKKLQGYFEENPADLAALRRDKALHTVKVQQHLSHIPEYLLPAALRSEEPVEDEETVVEKPVVKKRKQPGNFGSAKRHKYKARQSDPLKSFEVKKKTATGAT
ncbi:probable ATP-dependent RNA helicase DDX56 [Manduca sexta]|uniref:probable ATP-dependent RNA helicase DDX56 n=1 Tax=Manduca sexta TaxID=7130 RepID=UPI00188F4332|nr:probable ATP-dependent RNA helicase DDX56 [Manduca sexta]XP_030036977.2 probable ATP-dependent RNA helicase DDX56 [Manduca sexta]XP_030036978.2 probable ATP-dependent RNA helicase DDX56 [Manduca sexta]